MVRRLIHKKLCIRAGNPDHRVVMQTYNCIHPELETCARLTRSEVRVARAPWGLRVSSQHVTAPLSPHLRCYRLIATARRRFSPLFAASRRFLRSQNISHVRVGDGHRSRITLFTSGAVSLAETRFCSLTGRCFSTACLPAGGHRTVAGSLKGQ